MKYLILCLFLVGCFSGLPEKHIYSIVVNKYNCFGPASGFISSRPGYCAVITKLKDKCKIYRPVINDELIKVCHSVAPAGNIWIRECGTYTKVICNERNNKRK